MNKRVVILIILMFSLVIYLNQSYARIYNRNEAGLPSFLWNNPISFKNPNFQNSVKYVALGDSLTVGLGSNEKSQTFPYIFAENLSKNMSVSFVNLAIRGATSTDLINSQLGETIREKPNYVTLLIGVNDIHNFTSTKKFEENINHIISVLIEQTNAKIIILNLPYLGSKDLILFPFNIYFDYKTRQFNKIISKIASVKKLTLVDFYTPTKEIFFNKPSFYSPDSFHPSGEGYILWGNLLSEIK